MLPRCSCQGSLIGRRKSEYAFSSRILPFSFRSQGMAGNTPRQKEGKGWQDARKEENRCLYSGEDKARRRKCFRSRAYTILEMMLDASEPSLTENSEKKIPTRLPSRC